MNHKWIYQPPTEGECAEADALSEEIGISPVLCRLLRKRGIRTAAEAKKFFRPSLQNLHDPFLMDGMDAAVARINKALGRKERILVYGDYDVDGTTAVALVYKFLRHIGHNNLMFYIPDRYTEGYGISKRGIDIAAKKGVKLVIALDCGIKAVEKVDYATQKGVDFIICDHHLPAEEIPSAVAVLDPKRSDCNYPFDELSGCGVGFKLITAYVTVSYKNLAITFDSTKLLTLAQSFGANSTNTTISGLTSLTKSINGMKTGFLFNKK